MNYLIIIDSFTLYIKLYLFMVIWDILELFNFFVFVYAPTTFRVFKIV